MYLLGLLLALGIDDPPQLEPPQRSPATAEGVREVFSSLWDAPTERVTKLGGNILSRYRKKKGDMAEIQYAYGIVLARHHLWDQAEVNFRAAAEKQGNYAPLRLALCQAALRARKPKIALEEARLALETDPTSRPAVETIAVVASFLEAKPPAKFRAEDARKLGQGILAGLSPELQADFQAAQARVRRYIDELPALREKMMAPISEMQEDARKVRAEARTKEAKLATLRAEVVRRQAQIARIEASSAAETAQFQRMAARARQQGDEARARAYESESSAAQAAAQARIEAEHARLEQVHVQGRLLEQELAEVAQEAERLESEVEGALAAIEAELASPPPFWDPVEARDRFLAEGMGEKGAPPSPPERAPRKELTDEDRAGALLQVADALRQSGRPELAKRYFERIVNEYPETRAAKDAQWELEQMKGDSGEREPAPKKKVPRKPAARKAEDAQDA